MEPRTIIYEPLHLGKRTGCTLLVTRQNDLGVDDSALYNVRILDNQVLVREFCVKIAGTQATRPAPEADVAEWFDRIHPERIPQNGDTVTCLDLDEVRRY